MSAPAKSGRITFGTLIIKEPPGITDKETVDKISENPYLQYLLAYHEFQAIPLFDPSIIVHFRRRKMNLTDWGEVYSSRDLQREAVSPSK